MTDILRRYRELRSLGFGESRARVEAAVDHARSTDCSVGQAMTKLAEAIKTARDTPTRSGGLL